MLRHQVLPELSIVLARLYFRTPDIENIVIDSGLSPERVSWTGTPLDIWTSIVDYADRQGYIEALLSTNWIKCKTNANLVKAMADYDCWVEAGRPARTPMPAVDGELRPQLASPGFLRFVLDRWFPRIHSFLTGLGSMPAPRELSSIDLYLRDLSAHIRQDFRRKTYLPLAAQSLRTSRLSRETTQDPFVSPVQQTMLQLVGRAKGGDSSSAQVASANRRSKVVRNILKALDKSTEPLILLGEPGSGKTMTLQQAAMAMADREVGRVYPRVPLFVSLGEFHVDGQVRPDDVREHVKQSIPPSIRHLFDELEYAGRLVIFFDGMDEMSRDRYGEHTEALSVFAAQSPSKTLFTCRITDFSPNFIHRRLVLLPFDRHQISEYLSKYIERFPASVDGRSWTRRQLAERIARGGLPVEANNPFVLWLLCLFITERTVWPDSRVDLLSFYNQENYERKAEERTEDEPPFPPMEDMFREWARLAYTLAERNLGTAIPVSELDGGRDPNDLLEMIHVGKLCGILAESREKHQHLVRFAHHRFEEYFAAVHIHETSLDIDWLDKFDAPRWQETMINLVQMGESGGAVKLFADSVSDLTQRCQAEIETETEESEREIPEELETVLAERVELSARIMRQSGFVASDIQDVLMPGFREAVSLLAEHGNPITQVKTMRACRDVPGIDFIDTLGAPLHSQIGWVRNQALLIIGSSQGSARAVGSDLVTEMGYDLASGLFPRRWPTYLKAVREAKSRGHWWGLAVSSLLFLVHLVLLLAVAGLVYWSAWTLGLLFSGILPDNLTALEFLLTDLRAMDFGVFGEPITLAVFGALVIAAAAAAFLFDPTLLWAGILAAASGVAVFAPVVSAIWAGQWASEILFVWLAVAVGMLIFGIVGVVLAAPVHIGMLGLFQAATRRVRQPGHNWAALRASMEDSCGYGLSMLSIWYSLRWVLPLWFILTAVAAAGFWIQSKVSGPIMAALSSFGARFESLGARLESLGGQVPLPFTPLANGLIIAAAALTLLVLFLIVLRALWTRSLEPLRSIPSTLAMPFALAMMGLLVWISTQVHASAVNLICLRALVVIFSLPLLAVLLFLLWNVIERVRFTRFLRSRKSPPGSSNPEDWKSRFKELTAEQQHDSLLRTDHQSLSLTPSEFLEVLKEIEPLVKAEPAVSTYWAQRDQLEEVLRQERQG